MKKNIKLNEVLSLEGFIDCKNRITTIASGFKLYEFNCYTLIEENCINKNIILFFLKGYFMVNCNQFTRHQFAEQEMVLLPKSSMIKISGQQDNRLVLMYFDAPEESCDKNDLQLLINGSQSINYCFSPISIRYPLASFLEMLVYCLQTGMDNNVNLHHIMHREFFLLLKGFYSKNEIIALFYPIIGKEPDFRDLIMENYLKVDNIEELILLTRMGRSSFYVKFKETFGITAKQWMQKQIGERILGKVIEPGISVKQLMETCGFESHSRFYRYFKQHFKCTPKEFIERYQCLIDDC